MTYFHEYNFAAIEKAALKSTATDEEISMLGEWYRKYGMDYWNGEEYQGDNYRLRPIIVQSIDDPDEYTIAGYEFCF